MSKVKTNGNNNGGRSDNLTDCNSSLTPLGKATVSVASTHFGVVIDITGAKVGSVAAGLGGQRANLLTILLYPLTQQISIDAVLQCYPGDRNARL